MTQRSPVTLRHVAERAGVHTSTASRALNPATRSMLKPALAEQVDRAASELGYRPHPIASSLRTNRTLTIGVIIPDLTNPLFPPIIRGIEDRLATSGYTAIIANTDNDPDRNRLTVERMRERRVDGLILATARRRDPLIAECRRDSLPMVLINRTVDGNDVACIVNDDVLGMQLVVDHVAGLGHRHIAYVGGPETLSTGARRHSGFLAAMAMRGIETDERLVVLADAFREDAGRAACRALIERGAEFTALLAGNDLLAFGCLDALTNVGRICPDDVSITGFNDMPFLKRVQPPLTTVRIAHYDMGARAAETMLALVSNSGAKGEQVLLEPALVVRGSTAQLR